MAAPFYGAAQAKSTEDAQVLRQAKALRASHQTEAAIQVLNSFLSMHAEDADGLTLLAEIRVDQGDLATAKDLLTRALASAPNSLPTNDSLGKLLLEEHQDPEAMDRFETVLTLNPQDKEARAGELSAVTELAVSARQAGRPDAALLALQHARTKLLDDPKLLLELGIQNTEMGLLPDALEALQNAQTIAPNDSDVLYALSRVELEEQHMPAAEAHLRAYLVMRPNDASAHYGLGHILAMEQRSEDARAEFEHSIQLQPVQTESYYQLGQIELEYQHDSQAEPLFQKVLARDPTHGGALTGMGILAFRKKAFVEAEQYLSGAEKTMPDYQPAHYYRGLVLARLGQKEESQRELLLAVQLDRKQQGPPRAPMGASANAGSDTAPH
jgi:tetratricopeptide (TPR) repeat protein